MNGCISCQGCGQKVKPCLSNDSNWYKNSGSSDAEFSDKGSVLRENFRRTGVCKEKIRSEAARQSLVNNIQAERDHFCREYQRLRDRIFQTVKLSMKPFAFQCPFAAMDFLSLEIT